MNHRRLTEEPIAEDISICFDKIQLFWYPDESLVKNYHGLGFLLIPYSYKLSNI